MTLLWYQPNRLFILLIALLLGAAFIAGLTLLLEPGTPAAQLLLDYQKTLLPGSPFVYPFTVQNLMHLILFAGLGEVYCRWRTAVREHAMLGEQMLPEAYEVVLQAHDLPAIRSRVSDRHAGGTGFLPGLVDLCILQFLASRSVDQTVTVMNSSLELMAHRVDLRYAILRYIAWLIPTIGFIGTIIGISLAMALIDPGAASQDLGKIAQSLGIAFYTTLVALVQSAILVLLLNLVQAHEELALNQAGEYTLKNLINRLYVAG